MESGPRSTPSASTTLIFIVTVCEPAELKVVLRTGTASHPVASPNATGGPIFTGRVVLESMYWYCSLSVVGTLGVPGVSYRKL